MITINFSEEKIRHLAIITMDAETFYDRVILSNSNNFDVYMDTRERLGTGFEETIEILKNDAITEILRNEYSIKKLGNYGLDLEDIRL